MAFINNIVPLNSIPPVKTIAMSTAGIIPVAEYKDCIAKIQSDFSYASLRQVLGSVRRLYYDGIAFSQLIPNSEIITPPLDPYDPEVRASLIDRLPYWRDRSKLQRIMEKASENGQGDNPSPYIEIINRSDKELVDVGHLLLTFDALSNTNTSPPYSRYKIANIDIASWVADLAIAAYWNDYLDNNTLDLLIRDADFLELKGSDTDALRKKMKSKPSGPTADDFLQYSAPESDLLGDIDGIVMMHLSTLYPNKSLADLFYKYYMDPDQNERFVHKRFKLFCIINNINYDYGTKDWVEVNKVYAIFVARIDRCIDLFHSGTMGSIGRSIYSIISPPPISSYPSSKKYLQKFLDWLKIRLQKELLQTHGNAIPTNGRLF